MIVQVANIHTHNANCPWHTKVNECVFEYPCVSVYECVFLICSVSVISTKVHPGDEPVGMKGDERRVEGKCFW